MAADAQTLSPATLGSWTRCIRTASHLSQEALAEASGLPTRTIQRIEAGRPTSVTTRRSLARGLGYENLDVFDDPTFVVEVHRLLERLSEHDQQQQFPDHIKVQATPVHNGEALGQLIGTSEAYLFNCENGLPPEVKEADAALFDLLRDYGDIWSELSHADRLSATQSFDENLVEFEHLGARLYTGTRLTHIVGAMWTDKTPMPFTIGYVVVIPQSCEIEHILVPKRV
ncbi:helix-turn-helix transcriptional regulator [Caulobacter sp. KR2-114]|uniref:helix-turn-helix transcriptional regulator n=1 Tax=Caulobacter sp. KR2-114 TaxID=3400912 RepID=UPI003C0982F0